MDSIGGNMKYFNSDGESGTEQIGNYKIAYLQAIGGRPEQQDCIGFSSLNEEMLVVLCDGMGGHKGGRLASQVAVEGILSAYENEETKEKKEYYSGYYIINLDTDMYTNYMFEFNLSLDTYINGVHDNYVYLFDKNALAQYRVDVKKQFTEMVCNEDKNNTCIVYENGEEKKKNIYDFKDEEIYFTDDSKEYKDINYEFLKRFNNNTVIYYDGENIYKVYNDDLDNKIKLYTIKDAKTIRIHKNYIYFIVDNTIYRFDEQNGAVKLVEFKDFKTNYNNIYDIYIKESK